LSTAAISKTNESTSIMKNTRVRSFAYPLLCAIVAFLFAPGLRAETPPDQIKAAGAIPLTTDLLDKMDKTIKALSADDAAKTELSAIGKDPNMTPESWAAAISSKCPKAAEHFKAAGITPDDFAKGIFAIMACAMSEDMAKSTDKNAAANATFVAANKEKAEAIFGGFMMLGENASSSPAATP
jgi:hypothetical protein